MTETIAASTGAVSDAWHSVALFVPKFLAFLVILVVGWLVARLLRTVVDKVLARVGFDKWVERGGIKAALARSKYDAADIVARLVYYAVLLFTLQLAFGVWGPNPVSDLIRGIVAWLPKALVAIIIVVVAAAIARAVRDLVGNALSGLSYGRLLANVGSWFIIGLGVIAALNQIGVATTVTTPVLIAVLATFAGILIIGVGGGLVRPMQRRWEGWLDRASAESAAIAEQAKAYSAGQRDAAAAAPAQEAAEPVSASVPAPASPSGAVSTPAPASAPASGAAPVSRQVGPAEKPIPKFATGTASPPGPPVPPARTAEFPKQPAGDATVAMPPASPQGPGNEYR